MAEVLQCVSADATSKIPLSAVTSTEISSSGDESLGVDPLFDGYGPALAPQGGPG
jgi:hypothetical protein